MVVYVCQITSFSFPWSLKNTPPPPKQTPKQKKQPNNTTCRRVKLVCSCAEETLPLSHFKRNTEICGLAVFVFEDGLYVIGVLR